MQSREWEDRRGQRKNKGRGASSGDRGNKKNVYTDIEKVRQSEFFAHCNPFTLHRRRRRVPTSEVLFFFFFSSFSILFCSLCRSFLPPPPPASASSECPCNILILFFSSLPQENFPPVRLLRSRYSSTCLDSNYSDAGIVFFPLSLSLYVLYISISFF